MKILVLTDGFPPDSCGGAQNIAQAFCHEFVKLGHEVIVVTTVQKKEKVGEQSIDGMKIISLYTNISPRFRAYLSLYNPQTVSSVRAILQKEKPDIVHAHNLHQYLSYACLKEASRYGARVFLTAHDCMSFHYGKFTEFINPNNPSVACVNPSYKLSPWQVFKAYRKRYNPFRNIAIRRYFKKYVDKIIPVSYELEKALNANGIQNTFVIHNGIDPNRWIEDPKEIEMQRKDLHLAEKRIILFAGRLNELKGGKHILAIAKRVFETHDDTVLLIAGSHVEGNEKRMEADMRRLGIQDRVIFSGWVDSKTMSSLYRIADVVVIPSIYLDPFPTITLEAMACERPVVGTCFGGTKESIIDGKTGYVVNPFDIEMTAGKIAELLKTHATAKALGDAGRKRVQNDFALDAQAKKYLTLFCVSKKKSS